MNKIILKKYAHLIAACGVNIQKGQDVVITASFDQIDFIRMLVLECYKCGAKYVMVLWSDPKLTIYKYKFEKLKDLSRLEKWEEERWQHWKETLPCRIYILSDGPESLSKINIKKYGAANKELVKIVRSYRDEMDDKYQWCIAGVPSVEWAKKVFPNLSKKKAVEALWKLILEVSRAYEGDPIKNWEQHDANLHEKMKTLNALNLRELEYHNSLGTDFKVGLIPDVMWLGGGEYTMETKVYFQPNIPTEEMFTSPLKGKAEGIVYASKPLCYRGQLIEDFWFKFHEGKVVEYGAKKGQELLTQMLEIDEGASYLGEVSLIPYDSPINNTKVLFYETLYDENASCHIALGTGFPTLLKGYENMTKDEIKAKGINYSGSHVDFMIGTKDLDIVGIDDKGNKHQIFKDGNWAI